MGKKGTKKWARRALVAEAVVEERNRLIDEKDAVIRAKDDTITAQAGEIISLREQAEQLDRELIEEAVAGVEAAHSFTASAAASDSGSAAVVVLPAPPVGPAHGASLTDERAPEPAVPAAPGGAVALNGQDLTSEPLPGPTDALETRAPHAATAAAAGAAGLAAGTILAAQDPSAGGPEQPPSNGPEAPRGVPPAQPSGPPNAAIVPPVALRSNMQAERAAAEATGGVGMATDAPVLGTPSANGSARPAHNGLFRFLFVHEIDDYPSSGKRTGYLALAVLATIVLYYTYYTQTGVTPNILRTYHMSFSFYVWIVIVSNLIGAFASLPASKTDKLGRANVIIYGLLIVGLLVAVGVPLVTGEWGFAIVISALGLVEGAILVATPAMVRDFSPQVGRASAMGFWTVGPVAGSLLTSIVASNTLNHFLANNSNTGWKSQFVISGVTSLVVFAVSLFFMKDLSAKLRDQLMVSEQDRALIEARARGISTDEVVAATVHPWRQIFKWDLVGSSFGIAVFLLVYYAAAGFFTIFYSTVFVNPDGLNFTTTQANHLNAWFWGADAVALIAFGVLSDRLKVRKPFMLVGAVGSIITLIIFSHQAGHPHTSFSTIVTLEVILAGFLSLAYAPWMAGYTEMVEKKNPALVGTGLALWGWILRLVVGISFIFLPLVITSVNPVVDNLPLASNTIPGTNTNVQDFLVQHPESVAFAQAHAKLLTLVQAHEAVVEAAATNPTFANDAAVAAAIGTANALELNKLKAPFEKLVVPFPKELSFLAANQAHLTQLQNGVKKSPSQWQDWFWVCVAGMVVFIPTIWLNRGRWSPKKAREDEDKHEEDVARELHELVGAPA